MVEPNPGKMYSDNIIRQTTDVHTPINYRARAGIGACPDSSGIARTIRAFRSLELPSHTIPSELNQIETAQKWLMLPGKNGKMHKFPLQSILPKVQMTRQVPLKQLPLDVEVERRRRQYANVDLAAALKTAGVDSGEIMPTEEQYYQLSENLFKHYLPISFFDDFNYDCHSQEAWLKLGIVDGEQYPVPAKAFLPKTQSLMNYDWQYAAVSHYNQDKQLWRAMVLMDECVYEVPKVQFMFLAENPDTYIKRLKSAIAERKRAESLIAMEAIVDCVLLQSLPEDREVPLKCIEKLLRTLKATAYFMDTIRTEIFLVFEHLMACYEFEKFVKLLPKEFPTFSPELIRNALPKRFVSEISISECQLIKKLGLNMKNTGYNVLKTTLFYIGAGIEAMGNVAIECQYIETMTIFVINFAKALPLSDFLQAEQQHSSFVASYLKNYWPSKISAGICLVLRALGKGWLDISLHKWTVYAMCKISRFILQTKYRMEESMQVLLEKSIDQFARFVTDPCHQFLHLDDSYKWPYDFIQTDFPYHKPIFALIINIIDEKVVYSTNPNDFQPALMEIFKKALEKTSGVRCIDAETMSNLRFAPNLYILTVELIEDLFIKWNDLMMRCYAKAIIPLFAYAKLFERFIPFVVLNMNEFIKNYAEAKKTSLQVKWDILEYKRQKAEIIQILPGLIVIGPFQINVDQLKQYMIKKYIEIVKRLFEYYINRMYRINEQLAEDCMEVYNKIAERPQSIEHLYDIRDFSVLVPERVEELRGEIQVMWLEYEMLDSFFYNLSDQQFAMKWDVYAWPHKIMQRLSTLREEQKNDIEEFKRIHLSECIGFEERLESLNEEIQAFSLQFDPEKVMETAVDAKKTWNQIQELKKVGSTLKYRQTLFELEELNLDFLNSIIDGFTPYRNLWYSCSDFIKLEEATIGNPIINVDLDDAWESMEFIRSSLTEAIATFYEKEEVQDVAKTFLAKLNEFIPTYTCIKDLKNENWLFMHWQELGQRSGMEIKYSAAINFVYLLKKGIASHFELVSEISGKASADADAIRKAIEDEERRLEEERQALLTRKALRKCRTDIL